MESFKKENTVSIRTILITYIILVCMIDHSFPLYRFVHTTNRDTRDNRQVYMLFHHGIAISREHL